MQPASSHRRQIRNPLWVRFLFGCLLILALASQAWAQPPRRVLALHSYHPGYSWQQSIDQSLESILSQEGNRIQLFHEYMDTLRKPDPGLQPALFDYLRATYAEQKPDVLVASDNDALTFLLNYRDWLFGPVPVVFLGINDFTPDMLRGQPGYTGVVEDVDMGSTLEAVLRLRPQTKRVVAFGTNTSTFFTNTRLLHRALEERRLPLQVELVADQVFSQILERVRSLGPEDLLVVLSPVLDDNRALMPVVRSTELLAAVSPAPVVSFWEFLLGHGTLGGRLVSGQEQGRVAGQMVLRILAGEPVGRIPVLDKSPNRDIFDYAQLERFGLSPQDLPPGAALLGAPDQTISRYRNLTLGGLALILVLGGAVAVLTVNVARRRRAEAALKASEELFSKAFKSSPAWVAISTLDEGRYLMVNNAFSQISGFDPQEVLGRTSVELDLWVDPEDRRRALAIIAEKGTLPSHEVGMRFKGGPERRFLWTADPIDFAGQPCLISVLWEVTEMRRAQRERDQMEAQLRQAQKMEALGTLAGGIAHDFNNILGGILGFAELAQQQAVPGGKQDSYLEQVVAGCQRARDLVRQILTFSRRHETQRQPILAAQVAREMLQLLRATLPTSIELEAPLDCQTVVLADPTELHLLLLNLCTNAAQAMDEGGGKLTLSMEEEVLGPERTPLRAGLDPGPYLAIKVSDTGHGMDHQTMARVFDPFFTTKGTRGTGLGLSVVHGITQSLGGTIEVKSALGQGSCFTVFIPRVEAAPCLDDQDLADIPTGQERVLLVDDEQALVDIGTQMLHGLGYTVESFSDSRQALRRFQASPWDFDLLVTDLTMPGISGRELALDAWRIRPGLPVLVLTGYSQPSDLQHLQAQGPLMVLAKPLGRRELAQAMRQVLAAP